MPIKQQLSSTRDHISFTPVSSNESPTSSDYESATSLDAASSDYKSATSLDGESSDAASSDYASSDYKSATSSDAAPLRIQSMPLPAPTQFDIFANCQPTPLLLKDSENQNNDENVGQIEEANQGTAGPVLTPPRNVNFTPPKNVNYSNPNLSSSLESDDECRIFGFTDRDLVANHQLRPSKPCLKVFQNQNNGQEVIQIKEEVNQGTAGPVSTPPKNVHAENHRAQKNVRKVENTTRRMRSVSESDHSEPVSLPIVAFTKSTGQIDGRYSPKDSKNYSNPNLSSFLESDGECRKHRFTERDLVANHQPRPIEPLLKDFENQNNSRDNEQIEDDNQGIAGPVYSPLIMNDDEQIDEYDQGIAGPLLTPPETSSESIRQENESSGCCSGICMKVCCSLFQRKNILKDTFTARDIFMSLIFIGVFLFDVISDLALAEAHYTHIEDNEIYRVYFGLTLGFVIGPSLVLQVCSYPKKQQKEIKKKEKDNAYIPKQVITDLVTFCIHFLQLAVIFRQIRSIFYGLKLRYYECVMNERDREMFDYLWRQELENIRQLHLIEAFLEAAPQLILQVHIVLTTKQIHPITMCACVASLLSLSLTMTQTQRYLRKGLNNKKTQLSILATFVIFCWKACTILSRVVVFGLFLTVQPIVFVVFIILHWLFATVWIAREKTDFSSWKADAKIYGFVYIFCFIDVHNGKEGEIKHSKFQMFVFYAVVAIENVVLSCGWYLTQIGSHTGLSFGNLSSTSLNETIIGLPFGNLSNNSSNEAIVENELFPTESAAIFQRQHAFIFLMVVHGFFLLGMFFMQVYYQALHSRHFKGSSPNYWFIRPGTITPFSARLGSRTVLEL